MYLRTNRLGAPSTDGARLTDKDDDMGTPHTLEPEHITDLIADPQPFLDALDRATDFAVFRAQVRDAIDYMLRSYGITHDHAGRAVPDNEAWRQASRDELAARIATHLCAGLAPQMEQHNHRAFLGALELVKHQRAAKEENRA